MRDYDYSGITEAAENAVRAPEFGEIQRRAGRMRRRRLVGINVTAALVLLVSAAGAVAVMRPDETPVDGPGSAPIDAREVRWAGAADPSHLYAVVSSCKECGGHLIASDDGGRTWRQRGKQDALALNVVGAKILVDPGFRKLSDLRSAASGTQKISIDGGKSWHKLEVAGGTAATVPAGTKALDCHTVGGSMATDGTKVEPCRIFAVDPASAKVTPLATQPPLLYVQLADTPAAAGLWVQGVDPVTRKPAMAVSHDAGRTWTTAVFANEPADMVRDSVPPIYLSNLATTNGRLAYALFVGVENRRPQVYRSTDGGVNWTLVSDANSIAGPLANPFAMVPTDGSHVLAVTRGSGFGFLSSVDGRTYVEVTLSGLPPLGHAPKAITADRFLTFGEDRLYLSDDGLVWRAIQPS